MDDRERRVGLNEAVFREVNERLESLNEAFATITETMELVCECARLDCAERIQMPVDEYEALRSKATHFAVIPGHEEPSDVEEVVQRCRGYDVIEKREGGPAELAEETDPRR